MKYAALIALACSLSSCCLVNMMNETTRAIHGNRVAIEMSTEAICRNIEAVKQSNHAIDENRKKLDAINESLNHIEVD